MNLYRLNRSSVPGRASHARLNTLGPRHATAPLRSRRRIFAAALSTVALILASVPLQTVDKAYADNYDPASGLSYIIDSGQAYVTDSATTTPVVPATLGSVPVVDVSLHNCGLVSIDVSAVTSLTSLSCGRNSLISLDVTHNPDLRFLNCYGNSLTSLDVSQNTAMTQLMCNANALASLDVTRNLALIDLECSNNKLTSLDLTRNADLRTLDCTGNLLTALNVTDNLSLTQMFCSSNSIASLDLKSNPDLDGLGCDHNLLSALDLSGNPLLNSLSCSYNSLTALDLSHNTALETVSCDNNLLTALDVSHNAALTDLTCNNNYISAVDAVLVPWLAGAGHSGTVAPQLITPATVAASPMTYSYTGSRITPTLSVVLGGTALAQGTQYTVSYRDSGGRFAVPTAVGNYTATITGTGSFAGTAAQTAAFSIVTSVDISSATVAADPSEYAYTGSAVLPALDVSLGATSLVEGVDYSVAYADANGDPVASPVDAGSYTATVTGMGGYSGVAAQKAAFTITPADISAASIAAIPDQAWTGAPVDPAITVTYNGTSLVEGVDYSVGYSGDVEAGTATATIAGTGNFKGAASAAYSIVASAVASSGQSDAVASALPQTGDSGAAVPAAVAMMASAALVLAVRKRSAAVKEEAGIHVRR